MPSTAKPSWLICFLCIFLFATPSHASDVEPPRLLLANVYANQAQLGDYWVSEKLDGVRAYWDGSRLISRQGNLFHTPAWFTAEFPSIPLDGELWMGRGTFEELSGVVRQQTPNDGQWQKVCFMVFDSPADEATFDQRLNHLQALFADVSSPYIALVHQFKVPDREALMAHLNQVVRQGGEGLMLHRGESLYRAVRSDDLLKLKTYEDAEAVVIGHLPGKGKYRGMLGALLVETPEQLKFRIGTGFSDSERENPPPVGSIITYKYFGKTKKGIPRFASFLRVREAANLSPSPGTSTPPPNRKERALIHAEAP